ncbi:hypothetical protein L515_2427 [Bordetella bronchiseptica MBORD665]|nr:hypothetical protein L515_2427 [Bordetella bronchiseptica MBORD665]KDC83752.1 hypothetical protein L516_2316 [Bordetella bronchiseptica MBORD668]
MRLALHHAFLFLRSRVWAGARSSGRCARRPEAARFLARGPGRIESSRARL